MKVSAVKFGNSHVSVNRRPVAAVAVSRTYKPSSKNPTKSFAYSAGILGVGLGLFYLLSRKEISPFAKSLAKSMTEVTGNKIHSKNLTCVMNGDELLKIIPKLEKKNYEFTPENFKNGIFTADLHSHSNYSDGKGYVKNLLEDAAEYADSLYKKTKQKFIFALTDHDTADGVKEALEIISSNPERYKNLRFVPGIELSFAHSASKSKNPCETSEILVYGINPFSENVSKFLNTIKEKRNSMINGFIDEASKKCPLTKFSFDEFSKYYEYERYGNLMNIHWRVYHYAQTKHAVTKLAGRVHQEPDHLYAAIMKDSKGASVGILHNAGKLPKDIAESNDFEGILKKYAPHFEHQKLIASSENTFEEIIDAFRNEKNIFMAFAHPCCYAEHVKNPAEGLKYFVEHSAGLIKASESYHQAYKSHIKSSDIQNLQTNTESFGLLNLGGRDNHNKKLF